MAELDTGATRAASLAEAETISVSFNVKAIVVLILGGLVFRLFLAQQPGWANDLGTFQAWAQSLAARGPWDFYQPGAFADYPPGYLYVLWLFGILDKTLHFDTGQWQYLLKFPSIVADLASAYVLYRLLENQRPLYRFGAPALYLLLPATIFIGPVWGQVDSLLSFFLLLTVFFLSRGNITAGAVVYTVGFLTKPQAVAALPFLVFWVLRQQWLESERAASGLGRTGWREKMVVFLGSLWRPIVAALGVALLMIILFFPDNPWGIFDQLRSSTEVYPYATFWAYNFWGVVWTRWESYPQFPSDSLTFAGIEYGTWGIILFGLTIVAVIVILRKAEGPGYLALGVALSELAFFVLLTRMHERYLFPFFLPFLAACVLLRNRLLWIAFAVLSLFHFLNLYYVYSYYNPNSLRVDWLFELVGKQDSIFLLCAGTFLALPMLAVASALIQMARREPESA